jgi:hypothetical protein
MRFIMLFSEVLLETMTLKCAGWKEKCASMNRPVTSAAEIEFVAVVKTRATTDGAAQLTADRDFVETLC